MIKPLLKINNLNISELKKKGSKPIIKQSNFEINTNEIVAIVGESGSGKSLTAAAIMGLLPKALSVKGEVLFNNTDLLQCKTKQFQKLRGNNISMIFQEPMSALNPSMRCGHQVSEIIKQHRDLDNSAIKVEVLKLFNDVKLSNPKRIYKAYPHQISGGQKQRVIIAIAIACMPQLLIADEPTTALDVTVQKEILQLLKDIQTQTKMSILFISHDLALVSQLANRVLVMYKGEIIEQGITQQIFKTPKHNYTKALIDARPSMAIRLKTLPTIADFMSGIVNTAVVSKAERHANHQKLYNKIPLLELVDVNKVYLSKQGWCQPTTKFTAVNTISFKVYPRETLGLVGESGCGKSTLANVILQIDKATSGIIKFKGKDITTLKGNSLRVLRKEIQIIFQDPYASLNPRLRVGMAILEPMAVHGIGKSFKDRKLKVIELLKQVGLTESDFDKFPHQFSGGQRQRIGIARAIAVQPKLIVCDESVSALDISVQAQVLNLLNKLKTKYEFTYIFISHDLAVVKYMSDQLLVMREGKIEEIGEADKIYEQPKTKYTKTLINAISKI